MGTENGGLRALRKQQTRQNISDVATLLFIARGFEHVTIAEVAAAAEVAKMTVTNYFPRKEDLVFDAHEEVVNGLARVVAARAPIESVFDALRRHYLAGLRTHDPMLAFSGPEFARLITDSPTLRARLRELHEEREHALFQVLMAEHEDALGARIVAATLTSTYRVLFDEVVARTLAGQSNAEIAEAMRVVGAQTFDLLAPAICDFGRQDW